MNCWRVAHCTQVSGRAPDISWGIVPTQPLVWWGAVRARVAQEQLSSVVQQVQYVFSQGVHAGVTHLLQIKDVLQEEQHLLLREQNQTLKA